MIYSVQNLPNQKRLIEPTQEEEEEEEIDEVGLKNKEEEKNWTQ